MMALEHLGQPKARELGDGFKPALSDVCRGGNGHHSFSFQKIPAHVCVCVCGETETDRQTKGREGEMGERERERKRKQRYLL